MSYPVPMTGLVYFYLSKKIRLDFSCESSAWQRIHLKHQVSFSLKNSEKILMNVVCCSHDWHLKVKLKLLFVLGKFMICCICFCKHLLIFFHGLLLISSNH